MTEAPSLPFMEMLEFAPCGVLVLDQELRIQYMNRVASTRAGLNLPDVLGRSVFEFVPEVSGSRLHELVLRCRDQGEPQEYEGTHQYPKLGERTIRLSLRRLGDVVVIFTEDATDLRQHSSELATSQAMFQAAFENASIGRSLTSPEGRLQMVNQALCQILGYDRDELQRLNFAEITHPDDLEASRELVRSLLAGEREAMRIEKRYRHRDGHYVDTVISSSLVRDPAGRPLHFVTDVLDVTKQKANQMALARSERLLRTVFDHAMIGIALVGLDGRVMMANPAYAEMMGMTPDQLRGVPFRELTHPDDLEKNLALQRALVSGEFDHYSMEKRFLRSDGKVVAAVLTANLIRDEAGQPAFALGLVLDVTEAVASRREAVALRERMDQTERLQTIGQLTGAIAHDFNNLLTVIGSYAGFALEALPPGDPARGDVQQIQAATQRAVELTRQLLAFSRKQVLEPRVVDIACMFENLSQMLGRLMGEKIRLIFHGHAGLPPVFFDPGQLQQVLVNLCVNARDAMPAGGEITLGLELRDCERVRDVENFSVRPGRYVVVQVADTGCGMDNQTVQRIFEPFFTTKPPGQGTGLGLSTVYGIIRQSHGYIDVRSTPGNGTTFELALPVAAESAVQEEKPASLPQLHGAGELVLVAEDELEVRQVVTRVLGRAGYRVLTAKDGAEALALFSERPEDFQLLLSDAVMPGMGGIDLLGKIRAVRPQLPVVLMSGYLDERISGELAVRPDVRFLRKPFSVAELCGTIRDSLDPRDPDLPPGTEDPSLKE